MLKRMRVGSRLNLLILLPILALAGLAVLAYQSLRTASLQGDQSKRLQTAVDLRADVLPPPANLLEPWMLANRLAFSLQAEATTSEGGMQESTAITVLISRIELAEGEYRAAYDKWWDTSELEAEVRLRLLGYGGYEADQFWGVANQLLLPAARAGDLKGVRTAIGLMAPRFDSQQLGVDFALNFAEREVFDATRDNNSLVDNVLRLILVAACALVVATLVLSFLVRRSIVRPIKMLSERAKSVANRELPMAVTAAQNAAPGEVLPTLAPFITASRDEIADLASSFSSVQDTALDLATEQAQARRVVSENLVNIARRNQSLLGRTLGYITRMEDAERDPDALDNLFRIDHLTTRMKRNAQSLLVLAGAEPSRLFAPAVPLGDVVRAALSEVENFQQIDLGDLGGAYVTGSLAPEIAHLFAELLENATTFSPPTERVQVLGRATKDGHQLVVVDYGIGLTADELRRANERLASVEAFDRESSKVLGHQVVARLGARHGIRVVLTNTPGSHGVTAVVFMPKSVLEAAPSSLAPVAPGPMVAHRANPVAPDAIASDRIVGTGQRASLSVPIVDVSSELGMEVPASELTSDELWEMFAEPTGRVPVTVAEPPMHAIAPTLPVTQVAPTASVPAADVAPAHAGMSLRDDRRESTDNVASGLAKRVRGAQLPDVAGGFSDSADVLRPAEQVRSALSSLQRGVDLGRRGADDSPSAHEQEV
jgi:HAMP domain-containing protein